MVASLNFHPLFRAMESKSRLARASLNPFHREDSLIIAIRMLSVRRDCNDDTRLSDILLDSSRPRVKTGEFTSVNETTARATRVHRRM